MSMETRETTKPMDYPAAHSMDTRWFGVDAAGEVAAFDSDQEGVRPIEVTPEQAETELFFPELKELMTGLAPPYRAERTAEEIFAGASCGESPLPRLGAAIILQMRSAEQADAILKEAVRPSLEGIHLPCRDGHLVFLDYVQGTDVPALCELFKPVVRWKFWLNEETYTAPSPAFYGFWAYRGANPGEPYRRHDAPKPPLRIEQLPERLRPFARRAVFSGIRFADTPILQPMEHMKCVAWSCSFFIDSTLKIIRPIPGCEEQYRADEAEIRRYCGRQYDIRPWNEPWPRSY